MRAARIDANQPEIVDALRAVGATVQPLQKVSEGCPDLLVGYRERNWLLEVKDPAKPPSARYLTPDQAQWHGGWKGRVVVVLTAEDALIEIGALSAQIGH